MSDVGAFLAACFSSPALLTSACALIVVPPLAWLIGRALAPSLDRMSDDPAWQAALAAGAAALPGILFTVIGLATLRGGANSACLQFVSGRVLYGAIAALTLFGIVRATWCAARRAREVTALMRVTSAPSSRLRAAGDAAGVRVREIAAVGPVVILVGVVRPVVVVSADAASRVNDAELLAAIRHEAAHARRGDVLCAAIVTFLADLVPLPVGGFLALFRRAREFAADAHATALADPCDLASALLSLARPTCRHASVAAFADSGTVRARIGALLAPAPRRPSITRRSVVTAALITAFVVGVAPALTAAVLGFPCGMRMG